jgi:hypothetical protein
MSGLDPLVGEWTMEATFPTLEPMTGGRVTFEWLAGGKFLVERWEVPVPEAPDGIAIIGFDEGRGTYLQHYFDSRGIARVYEMGLSDGVWTLSRTEPDFSPLPFAQRFEGTFSEDGNVIDGRWEKTDDDGKWGLDFVLKYIRTG